MSAFQPGRFKILNLVLTIENDRYGYNKQQWAIHGALSQPLLKLLN